jgi:hypothetical protein
MKTIRNICAVALASVAMCFAWFAFAATEQQDNNPPVMFVQSASGASLKDGKLMLMSPSTIFFSDRPGRLAGHMPCHKFIQAWSAGDDSFEKNPPNAVLAAFVPNGKPMKMVVTLQNPRFEGSNLIYDANVINGSVPTGMSEAALFIDDARLQKVYYEDVLPDGTVTGPIAPSANGG